MSGKLKVIVGPMYSGKTSELLSLVEIHNLGKKKFLVFKPTIDNRYSVDHIVSHTGQKVPAIPVQNSGELLDKFREEERKLDAIFIDEVNFFDDNIHEIVREIIMQDVNVFCVGLDMSYKHRPFLSTVNLMGIADEVIKKKAVCHICGEYEAVVSYKTTDNNDSEIDVGGREKYIAVCRECYKKLNSSTGKCII